MQPPVSHAGVWRGARPSWGCLHCPTLCSIPSMCGVCEEGPRAQPRGRTGERHQWCKLVCVWSGNPMSEEYQGQHVDPLGSSVCVGAQMHRRVSDRRGCPNSWGREGCLEGAGAGRAVWKEAGQARSSCVGTLSSWHSRGGSQRAEKGSGVTGSLVWPCQQAAVESGGSEGRGAWSAARSTCPELPARAPAPAPLSCCSHHRSYSSRTVSSAVRLKDRGYCG